MSNMDNFVNQAIEQFQNNTNEITQTQQEYIDLLRSGNSSKGEETARNLCRSMGITPEQGVKMAMNFLPTMLKRGFNPSFFMGNKR